MKKHDKSLSFPAALCLALNLASCTMIGPRTEAVKPVEVNLVAINDFHGHLEAEQISYTSATNRKERTVIAGGIDTLSATLCVWRAEDKELLLVGGGDLIGASPAMSSIWADEPTIEAINLLDLRLSALGDHDMKIGFISAVLRDTAFGIKGLRFADAADAINRLIPELKAEGVNAFVALIHEGGESSGYIDQSDCSDLRGPIARLAVLAVSRKHNDAGESPQGDLVADAELWTLRKMGGQVAFMNSKGLRSNLNADAGDISNFGQNAAILPRDAMVDYLAARDRAGQPAGSLEAAGRILRAK